MNRVAWWGAAAAFATVEVAYLMVLVWFDGPAAEDSLRTYVVTMAVLVAPAALAAGLLWRAWWLRTLTGLVVAVVAAVVGTRVGGPVWRGAMWHGCRWGLLIGALWVVEMTIANLGYALGARTVVPYFASTRAAFLPAPARATAMRGSAPILRRPGNRPNRSQAALARVDTATLLQG